MRINAYLLNQAFGVPLIIYLLMLGDEAGDLGTRSPNRFGRCLPQASMCLCCGCDRTLSDSICPEWCLLRRFNAAVRGLGLCTRKLPMVPMPSEHLDLHCRGRPSFQHTSYISQALSSPSSDTLLSIGMDRCLCRG